MSPGRNHTVKIPGPEEWAGYGDDFESRETHDFWFGKSLDDMQSTFPDCLSIQRAHELLFMPRRVFQFYVFAFAQYVMSETAIGDSDAASCFLGNLIAREEHDPGSVSEVYERLAPTVEFVGGSQARFDADHDIYGDFAEKAEKIKQLCGAALARHNPEDQMLDPTDDA
jgi:hypothetical protein